MRIRWPIRTWLLALTLGVALPLLGLEIFTLYTNTVEDSQQVQGTVLSLAQLIAANTEEFLQDSKSLMERIARRPLIRAADSEACDPFLTDFHDTHPAYANLSILNPSGQVVCTAVPIPVGQLVELGNVEWFREALKADRFAVGAPWFSPVSRKWVSMLTYPLHGDQGQVIGLLSLSIDLAHYQTTFDRITLPHGSIITIANARGTVVARSADSAHWVGQNDAGFDTTQKSGADGVERHVGFAVVAGTDWRVYVAAPLASLLDSIGRDEFQAGGLALVAILLVALIAFQVGRRIERPLHHVAQAARAVAQGDFAARAPVEGTAETALVASQLNEMLDIRLQAEQEERRLSRALRMLSNCNQAITRAANETALLQDICRIVVESGGYLLAWIGFAESDVNKSVKPIAYEGHEAGYLQQVRLYWDDLDRGHGPTGMAIRIGQPSVNRDTRTNPDMEPWRAEMLQRGYLSSMALPLRVGGITIGSLNIYAAKPDAFSPAETTLLTELADDLGFGVQMLRAQVENQRAQTALLESEGKIRKLVEQSVEGIAMIDPDGRIIEWNQSMERISFLRQADVLGKLVWDVYNQLDVGEKVVAPYDQVRSALEEVLRTGRAAWLGEFAEYPFTRPDGVNRTIQLSSFAIHAARGYMLGVIARDVTERKETETTVIWLASFPEMNPNPVLEVDLAGYITYCNPASQALLAALPPGPRGEPRVDISPADLAELKRGAANPLVREVLIGQTWYQQVLHYQAESQRIRVYAMDITQRKRMEMALYESEKRYREIVETVQEGIWIVDVDGKIAFANNQVASMLGYTLDELRGYMVYDFIADEAGRDRARQGLERRKQGLSGRGEFQFRRKDGSILWGFSAANPLYNEIDGSFKGSLATLVDITERKQTEQALNQYAQRFELLHRIDQGILSAQSVEAIAQAALPHIRQLVAAWRVSIAFFDPTTRVSKLVIVDANYATQVRPGSLSLTEFTRHADLEQGKLVYAEDVLDIDRPPRTIQALIGEGLRALVNVPLISQGTLIGILNLASDRPYAFNAGHLAIAQEVADQLAIVMRQAQLHIQIQQYAAELEQRVVARTAELHQAKEHVEAILNNSSDAIIVLRRDGVISQTNPAFGTLFGYSGPEVEGQPLAMLVDPNMDDDLLPAARAVILDHRSRRVETVAMRQNGSTFDADVALSAITGADGQTSNLIASVRDITVRKQLESDLQELNRLKTEFLSTAAHELRTPLTSIQGFSELLISRELDFERQKRYLVLINEQSARLRQIIDDLLDISRLEAKRNLALTVEPIEVSKLLNEVLLPFAESVAASRRLSFDLQECPPVQGDRFRLAQVVNNLLSNAVKYSQVGSMITVACRCIPDWVEVCVQDEGIGMSPEQMGHLFEQFYRANVSEVSGTGLGLTICKAIIELHHGTIWAESDYGHGSTFYFRLPVAG